MASSRGGQNAIRSMLDEGPARRRGRFAIIGEVYGELTKVTWPPREDAIRLSLLVLGVAGAMGVFLGLLWDPLFGYIMNRFILRIDG
ncbi:MAG: preprotein translocase subunit SecE [Chloroflexi bacterium]|nr:preprotein translocase subunit SecE [Chloroflexota bacterium]MCH7656055.1 preprotein translocase subunit SecE [Chloroflexota bacterium]